MGPRFPAECGQPVRVTRQNKNLVSVRTPPIHGVDGIAALAGITASCNITTVLCQLSGIA